MTEKKKPAKRGVVKKKSTKPGLVKKKPVARKVVKNKDEAAILADLAVEGIQEKKGYEIVSLDLRSVETSSTDFFIVCHAPSTTQVSAIAKSVEEFVHKNTGEYPWHSEGYENSEWILLDYVTVVVHIFQEDKRRFYAIEKLWADAEVRKIA